jgi:hypothetical protein
VRKIKQKRCRNSATHKIVRLTLWLAIFMAGPLLAEQGVQYFFHIPGIPGDVQVPGYNGWIACTAVQYRVPGVPVPQALPKRSPKARRGMLTAAEVEKPYATFSGPLSKLDRRLTAALRDRRSFPQWELALCNPGGDAYMALIFKNVTITSINRRDDKYYLTFKFQTVIWNYTGTQ